MQKLIQDIGFIEHIQKPKNARRILVVHYEELKSGDIFNYSPAHIKWIRKNGKLTPYLVTVI